jgi:hypothetical protein
MPFIVYIDYSDLFGAEHLCKLYLMQAGFTDIVLEKRKQLSGEQLELMSKTDTDIKVTLKRGFYLRMFDSH